MTLTDLELVVAALRALARESRSAVAVLVSLAGAYQVPNVRHVLRHHGVELASGDGPRSTARFLYLDSKVVDEFVSQVEGGLYGDEAQRVASGGGRKHGGEIGLGAAGVSAKASAGRESSSQDEPSRTMKQTPESRFARLYESLESEEAIQWLDALDDEICNQLRRSEVIEVNGVVALSGLNTLVALSDQFGPLLGAFQSLGGDSGFDEREMTEMMRGLGALATIFGKTMPLSSGRADRPNSSSWDKSARTTCGLSWESLRATRRCSRRSSGSCARTSIDGRENRRGDGRRRSERLGRRSR